MVLALDWALYSLLIVLLMKREIWSTNWASACFYSLFLVHFIAKITYVTTIDLTIFISNSHTNLLLLPLAHLVGGLVACVAGVREKKNSG